jgi:PAS domain S-box-containing protein
MNLNILHNATESPSTPPPKPVGFISDEVKQRLALKEQALSAIHGGVIITDPNETDNPIIYANDGFSRMTGYSREEVIGANCRFLQGAGTDRSAVTIIRDTVEHGGACSVLLLNYRKDGSAFWNQLDISPVRENEDPDGRLLYFVGVQTDATERILTERARAEADRQVVELGKRLSSALRIMPTGFILLDREDRFEFVNPHAEVLLGRSQDSVLGHNIQEMFPRAAAAPFWSQYDVAKRERREVTFIEFSEILGMRLKVNIIPTEDSLSIFFLNVTGDGD